MIKTKIVATVGPACRDVAKLRAMLREGADVFRLNLSHGTRAEHEEAMRSIRDACLQENLTVAVIADLCGPKIRIDGLTEPRIAIEPGQRLQFAAQVPPAAEHPATRSAPAAGSSGAGDAPLVTLGLNFPEVIEHIQAGQRVLIDDGQVRLEVESRSAGAFVCICRVGGVLQPNKGVNLPDTDHALPALTGKDRDDARWAVRAGVDYLALSFVRSAQEVKDLQSLVSGEGGDAQVIAKIERPQAIAELDSIIAAADGVLVARGDLGVEMDLAEVPLLQKRMIALSRAARKPVIVATQMLQSMIQSPSPTRAEVSDVANAILDATDAVMLSGETAVGQYPVAVLTVINNIARHTEAYLDSRAPDLPPPPMGRRDVRSAVVSAAFAMSAQLDLRLIAVWSSEGRTVRMLSKHRPPYPIIGLAGNPRVCSRMCLDYGVLPIRLPQPDTVDAMLRDLDDALIDRNLAAPDDVILVIISPDLSTAASNNSLVVHRVGARRR